jgi:hypothetical protein
MGRFPVNRFNEEKAEATNSGCGLQGGTYMRKEVVAMAMDSNECV